MGIRGFFSDEKVDAPQKVVAAKANCLKCGLDKSCKHPRMKMTGEGQKGIFFLAEAPGAEEDEYGKQLIGDAGQELRKYLKQMGV